MYKLEKSTRSDKKYMVTTPSGKKIHFGASGYEDYTIHKDNFRKDRYISRHQSNEDWTLNGIDTAGFWSRWILWNLPTIEESITNVERQFGIKITYNYISFEEAVMKLNRGDFVGFDVLLKSGNSIGRFIDNQNKMYSVELQYNHISNRIFPPI